MSHVEWISSARGSVLAYSVLRIALFLSLSKDCVKNNIIYVIFNDTVQLTYREVLRNYDHGHTITQNRKQNYPLAVCIA